MSQLLNGTHHLALPGARFRFRKTANLCPASRLSPRLRIFRQDASEPKMASRRQLLQRKRHQTALQL